MTENIPLADPYEKIGKSIESLCAFIDILGFIEKTKDFHKRGQEEWLFKRFQESLKNTLKFLPDRPNFHSMFSGAARWAYKSFSDSIVIGIPAANAQTFSEAMGKLLILLATVQTCLTGLGFFVRGAITKATIFIGDDIVFGYGLATAYELEKTKARDPRIIFEETIQKATLDYLKEAVSTFTPLSRAILKDSDGILFVNYLAMFLDEDERPSAIDHVKNHKDQIEKALTEYKQDPYIWTKYRWVANYHNYVCKEFLKECPSDLFIPDGLVTNQFSKPI